MGAVVTLEDQFQELATIIALATGFGVLGALLRQPLIIAFIAAGIAAGPAGLDAARGEELQLLAEVGVALLLFVVGLKLDLEVIRSTGRVALVTGIGQVVFTSVVGFGLAALMGFGPVASLYIAVALTFSSTIIIVKLLSDKGEIDSLHGRIAVGFLIVQDIVVVLTMIVLSALGPERGSNALQESALALARGGALLIGVAIVARWVLPRATPFIAKSGELLVLSAIGWAVALAVAGEEAGLSKEVGAFVAGVSLASLPVRDAISSRLTSLRDFLLLFFFVNLGAELNLSGMVDQLGPALVLSAFVLIGNPIIVMIIMGFMGYRRRTGFLAGLAVAQISEFSLIFAALGVTLGHVDDDVLSLVTFVGLVTIGLSTYLILYSHQIYDRIGRWLAPFEREMRHPEDAEAGASTDVDVLMYGLGRYGGALASGLQARGLRVLGVDFDPEVVEAWRGSGLTVRYGDADDPDLLAGLPLSEARMVVSTVPTADANIALLRELQRQGYPGTVVMAARSAADAQLLLRSGASLVLRPFDDAAEYAIEEITQNWESRQAAAGYGGGTSG